MKFILPFFIIVWVLVVEKRKQFSLILLSISGVVTWLVVSAMKMYFMIPRPFINLNLTPLFMESTYSVPSNHAAFFAALAGTSLYINKRLGVIVVICTFLIGISRIVVGVHTPLDVVAGFCVGIIVSYVCISIAKKIKKNKHI